MGKSAIAGCEEYLESTGAHSYGGGDTYYIYQDRKHYKSAAYTHESGYNPH